MEHRAPRLPEFMVEVNRLDTMPYLKIDILRLSLLLGKMLKEESEEELEYRLQAVVSVVDDLMVLVDAIVERHRELAKLIRKCKKKGTPEGDALAQEYENQRQAVLRDAVALSAEIPRLRFGRFFPKTWRRLVRRIKWLLTPKNGQTLSRPTAAEENFVSKKEGSVTKSNDSAFWTTRVAGIIDFSGGFLKTLSDKYLQNYKAG